MFTLNQLVTRAIALRINFFFFFQEVNAFHLHIHKDLITHSLVFHHQFNFSFNFNKRLSIFSDATSPAAIEPYVIGILRLFD